jgi:hypothetical protein
MVHVGAAGIEEEEEEGEEEKEEEEEGAGRISNHLGKIIY